MSTLAACCFLAALAIETALQLLDRGAGQHQGLVIENVVDVGADRREQIDLAEVRRSPGEADVERVAVDHQGRLAEAQFAELRLEARGLGFLEIEAVEHDQAAALGLGRERHPEPERADLLVQRRIEIADAGAVRLAAADEDRGAAIAVAGGAAALLPAELLAGAGDVGALAGAAGGAAALLELPSDDAVQDVGARLDAEHGVVELDVAAGLAAVEALDLDLHD